MATMRTGVVLAIVVSALLLAACDRGEIFRQYEYEEEIVLSLDGRATVYVNASLAALNALRGASFDTRPGVSVDREAVRAFFASPVTRVTRLPTLSRRDGRRFVHARLEVDDIRTLPQAAAFAWSAIEMTSSDGLVHYRQRVGPSAAKDVGDVGWSGSETVSFRAQLPSAVTYHNAGANGLRRGNILVWTQPLASRLRGEPLEFEARFESQSILARTLLLFGATALVVAACFGVAIWWLKRPRSPA